MNKESLHLTQEQRLQQRLSPQQVQFVRLLGMNRTEMEDEVRHEVLDNPAIEIADSDDSSDGEVPAEEMTTDNNVTPDSADPEDEPEDDVPAYRLNISNRSADDKVYEPIITNESTLIDYLSEQISEHDLSEKQQTIADYIIGNIEIHIII